MLALADAVLYDALVQPELLEMAHQEAKLIDVGKRWGLLKDNPDYLVVAKQINQVELYKQAATQVKVPVPKSVMRSSKLLDGTVWDGKDPKKYAASFKIRA